jgi:hypothetical protein
MKRYAKVLAASLLACTTQVTLAEGSPGVERQTEGFLNALAARGGKPLEPDVHGSCVRVWRLAPTRHHVWQIEL